MKSAEFGGLPPLLRFAPCYGGRVLRGFIAVTLFLQRLRRRYSP